MTDSWIIEDYIAHSDRAIEHRTEREILGLSSHKNIAIFDDSIHWRCCISHSDSSKKRSLRELIDEMKILRSVTFGNSKSHVYTSCTKLQKILIKKLTTPVRYEENDVSDGEKITR